MTSGSIPVRSLTAAEASAGEGGRLAELDDVMMAAYGVGSRFEALRRFAVAQPDGLIVALDGERIVASACCLAYPGGGFGWIGLVATLPGHQRRGLGEAVTEAAALVLAAHGCAPVLDASAAGGPLYERMGFVDHGSTVVLGAPATPRPALHLAGAVVEVCGTDEPGLAEVAAFDAVRFGGDRTTLLRCLVQAGPGRTLVARSADGALAGYGVAQEGAIGPVVADDPTIASHLVSRLLELDFAASPRICVPPGSAHLQRLGDDGWTELRRLRHMHRGIGALPGRRSSIAAQASLGEG